MTEPTDDELDAVIAEYQTRIYPQDMQPRFERAIMRAAIAKFGKPPAVAGEPMTARELADRVARGERWRIASTPQPLQAQAGAVPLTPEQITAAAKKLAECMDYPWEYMAHGGRAEMHKIAKAVIEAAGIKGGQHGADT